MTWGMVAVAGATLVGGVMSSNASNRAADQAAEGSQAAIDEQRRQFDLARGDQQGYMQYGQGAGGIGGLQRLMGGDYSGFMNSPDFKARVGFANEQFNNGAAANFRLFSGGAQSDRDALNQNLAAQGLQDYRGALQWGANLGQNAAAGVGQQGMNSANQIGGYMQNAANAQSQNSLAQGAYGASAINGLGSAASSYFGNRAAGGSNYGGGASAGNYGLPAPSNPYASTGWGGGNWGGG